MPLYPMIDDRMNTYSELNNNAPVWDYQANKVAWKLYLSDLYGKDDIPYYASPARATDYSYLPQLIPLSVVSNHFMMKHSPTLRT